MSESEYATLATLEAITESLETPYWAGSAQVAALTNTLPALTLAGVIVTNTSVEEVVQSLRKVVIGAEVKFTLRPRHCRPHIVERTEDRATFEVNLQECPVPTQQVVEVELVILSIQAGTVTLVPALTDIEPYEAPMGEVDDNDLTPVPRARFLKP